ncbi:hypothetical protein JL58_00520 [Listeria ivanovii subsp. londoniensis]|nr:FtsK/SpoIIIE domain-containing protein [Listeria ivanovii]AIS58564.1 hypothetical protein JL58_00520 [Listeria ivanovii subsp. londoniensis]
MEELNIAGRWAKNETYKSLAVPLGLRGKDDIVQLNLHEKAHRPHGLVAGTTGSGKSEIIQSYIISLGVNFHPYEVAYALKTRDTNNVDLKYMRKRMKRYARERKWKIKADELYGVILYNSDEVIFDFYIPLIKTINQRKKS